MLHKQYYLTCLLSLFGLSSLLAQTQQVPEFPKDSVEILQDKSLMPAESEIANSLSFYPVNAPEDLGKIGGQIPNGIPYVIIKRRLFDSSLETVRHLESKIHDYKEMDTLYQELAKIELQRDSTFQAIIAQEQARGQLFKTANDTLNKHIERLNLQFIQASDISHRSLKNRNIKNIRTGVVGGVIGLAAGVLFGVLANN